MTVRIHPSWHTLLAAEWEQPYFAELAAKVRSRYAEATVYPPAGRIFAAFDACPADRVKVVILGQDPYHGPGQANGMCFSVGPGVELPPSLVNIFKEVSTDTGTAFPADGDLSRWAEQGVLLLNSALTVDAHAAGSHRGYGWERLTDAAIAAISASQPAVVFMLWGSWAQRKSELIDNSRHLVLTAPHPSPLSAYRGFFGCRHFTRANDWLISKGLTPIQW
ncbi:MAG: uracil-DNA glycosylase [Candidatus Amulumruptor caecigallinarius]|nr:uracil-DNA glycosylase [Candidatus Amulumruptor caecigallinarius]MCM1395894.1 uracil-DNA glycosylase [Candidatus Amulumruptor caecigallinarius]MCM1452929.1 uracil-DNA glycosylase [bacterium]